MALVRRRLAPSRTRAREAIAARRVKVEGELVVRPSHQVGEDDDLTVEPPDASYVSRGGHKLAAALDRFDIAVEGRTALDAGASTGGFTECLLRQGASSVLAVDVGRDQLHPSLRDHPAVVSLEGTDIRSVADGPFDLIVADLSFISLTAVIGELARTAAPGADWILLVKPQFETAGGRVGKRGVVRDPAAHLAAVERVAGAAAAVGLGVAGLMVSPLTGGDGNREFLVWLRRGDTRRGPAEREAIVTGGDR